MKAGEQIPRREWRHKSQMKVHAGIYIPWPTAWYSAACTGLELNRDTLVELEDVPTKRRCRRPACAERWEAEGL